MVLVLVKQILAMVVMMAVGVALVKVKMVDEGGVRQLSSIAMYVATPAVIIQTFAVDFNQEQLVTGAWVALCVVAPLASLVILLVAPIPYEVRMALIISQATPCAASTSMLAQLFGADYQYGTGLVIMTTTLSMVSMPLLLSLAISIL